jgi:hypothetical protein
MIEKAIIRVYRVDDKDDKDLFNWFINQNHIPFDLSIEQYKYLYQNFINETISLFKRTKSEYYWFGRNGRLLSDEGRPIIDCNNFKIDIELMTLIIRDRILNEILFD